jgi:hypothetical protein
MNQKPPEFVAHNYHIVITTRTDAAKAKALEQDEYQTASKMFRTKESVVVYRFRQAAQTAANDVASGFCIEVSLILKTGKKILKSIIIKNDLFS